MNRVLSAARNNNEQPPAPLPRLGFAGIGWIGFGRMRALVDAGVASIGALCDPDRTCLEKAAGLAPDATLSESFETLLDQDLDGIVIATPSGLHAPQAIAALESGVSVFCQKPLGRNADEVRSVIAAARDADRLLDVDFSYRYMSGVAKMRDLIRSGRLGEVFAAELAFHNAYGPDKPWFYDPAQSGGGCLIDLGIHLVDLAFWMTGTDRWTRITGGVYAGGKRLRTPLASVEDFALADIALENGASFRLACSWRSHSGRDAVIQADFYGTRGAVSLRNVNGSFYDFTTEHRQGTVAREIDRPPDAWGGRALVRWAEKLRHSRRYDPEIEQAAPVARVLDEIYAQG